MQTVRQRCERPKNSSFLTSKGVATPRLTIVPMNETNWHSHRITHVGVHATTVLDIRVLCQWQLGFRPAIIGFLPWKAAYWKHVVSRGVSIFRSRSHS